MAKHGSFLPKGGELHPRTATALLSTEKSLEPCLSTAPYPTQGTGRGRLPTRCQHGQAVGFVLRSPGLRQSRWKQRSDNFQGNQTTRKKQAGDKISLEAVKIHHGCICPWGKKVIKKFTSLPGKAPSRSKSHNHWGTAPSKPPQHLQARRGAPIPLHNHSDKP